MKAVVYFAIFGLACVVMHDKNMPVIALMAYFTVIAMPIVLAILCAKFYLCKLIFKEDTIQCK